MFDISLARLINQTVRAQPLSPRCGWTATSGAGETCATRCSRQCNQAKCAITHRVDLTSGHLVKLKTRHLRRTRSLPSITPIAPDWLRGELQPYKCYGEPLWEAWTSHSAFHINSHHPLHRCFHQRRSVPTERNGTSCLSYLPLLLFHNGDGETLSSGIRQTPAKMKLAILCLCLASTASAAPVSTEEHAKRTFLQPS